MKNFLRWLGFFVHDWTYKHERASGSSVMWEERTCSRCGQVEKRFVVYALGRACADWVPLNIRRHCK